MADQKIIELTETTSVTTIDVLPIVVDTGGTPVTKKVKVSNLIASSVPLAQQTDTLDPTGWLNPDAVAAAMTYDSSTQKITITGTHYYYWRGVKSSITNLVSSAHTNTVGHQYYLASSDGSTFTWTTDTVWTFDIIQVAVVNYQTAVKWAQPETHGLMPWQVHEEFHQIIGTYKEHGGTLDPASYTLNSTTASNRRPNVVSTTLHDEDLDVVLPALTSSTYNKFTLSGASTINFSGLTADIVPLLAANPYYNLFSTPNWTQVLMASNSYMCVWLVAMPVTQEANSQSYRYLWVQGQSSGTLASQQALSPVDISLGSLSTESTEFAFLLKIIIRYAAGDWSITQVDNLLGSKLSQSSSAAGNYLSGVSTDGSLSGVGSLSSPLSTARGTTTATAAGTTTLTFASERVQEFTGSTTQTVVLPIVTTLRLGQEFIILNNSSGIVTVQSSGANTIQAVPGGTSAIFRCILITGTTAASWFAVTSMTPAQITDLTDGGETALHSHAGGGGGGSTSIQFSQDSTATTSLYGIIAGSVDGSNKDFTVSQGSYVTGTLSVYLNGQLLTPGASNDWTETTPASGTFAFIIAPSSGSVVSAIYQETTSAPLESYVCNGRLTLETGVAISTTDQADKTTLYFTPYKGNQIGLYDGSSAWATISFAELSLNISAYTASKPYDIWVYNNAGTATLDSTVWTNDTTRATALTLQDGVLVKTGATTRRYIGTIYMDAASKCQDTVLLRYVWNYYNRFSRKLKVLESTTNWTYTTATWRATNNSTSNRFYFVIGVSEAPVSCTATVSTYNTSNASRSTGIALDVTNANHADLTDHAYTANVALPIFSKYVSKIDIGLHFLQWVEYSEAAGTSNFYGSGTTMKYGMVGEVLA